MGAIAKQMKGSISPRDNLVTIKCGYVGKEIEFADGTKGAQSEQITFCAKQFLLNAIDDAKIDKKPLCEREDIKYLISFKRLQGGFAPYCKVINSLVAVNDFAEALDWEHLDLE